MHSEDKKPEEIIQEQMEWHAKTNQGCIYAAYIAKMTPKESNISRVCLYDEVGEDLFKEISGRIESGIKDGNIYMLTFLLPKIKTLDNLINFLEQSEKHTNWTIDYDDDSLVNQRLVKVRVPLNEVDEHNEPIFGWLLGFAPLDFLPKTRQSPFFEISLLVKSKYFLQKAFNRYLPTQHSLETQNRGTSTSHAHLADLYIKDVTDNPRRDTSMWNNSTKQKYKILAESGQNHDINAKAKITFSYPLN